MKSVYRILFLIIIFFPFFCLGQKETDNEKDTLKYVTLLSNIKNDRTHSYFYFDKFLYSHAPFQLENRRAVRIKTADPLLLINAISQVPIMVFPGDTIEFVKNGMGHKPISKSHSDRNRDLTFFDSLYRWEKEKIMDQIEHFTANGKRLIFVKDEKEMNAWIRNSENTYFKRVEFLKEFDKRKPLTDEFKNYAVNFFTGVYILQVMAPFRFYDKNIGEGYIRTADSLRNALNGSSEEVNAVTLWAAESLSDFIFKYKQPPSLIEKYNLISENFTGNILRFLLWEFFDKYRTQPGNPKIDSLQNEFIMAHHDDYANALLNQLQLVKSNAEYPPNTLINIHGEKFEWAAVLSQQKGKIVFVDFWASWCVPCRKEIPSSAELSQYLKERNIVFIYLSIDKIFQQWVSAMQEERLPKENSFLIQNFDDSDFKKRFNIDGIPRYIIINKNGEVINDGAPSPSSEELKKLLLKLSLE